MTMLWTIWYDPYLGPYVESFICLACIRLINNLEDGTLNSDKIRVICGHHTIHFSCTLKLHYNFKRTQVEEIEKSCRVKVISLQAFFTV